MYEEWFIYVARYKYQDGDFRWTIRYSQLILLLFFLSLVLARNLCLWRLIVHILVQTIFILILMWDYDLCRKFFTVLKSMKYPSQGIEIMLWQLMRNKTCNYCVYKILMLGQTYITMYSKFFAVLKIYRFIEDL